MKLIFLDTETTGVNPERHRTLDIAYKIVDTATGHLIASYESLVSQPVEIFATADPDALKINGITYEMILQGKTEMNVAADIIFDFNKTSIQSHQSLFICQNPSFDRLFFTQLIDADIQEKYNWPYHWLDLASMFLAVRLTQDKWNYHKLAEHGLSKDKIAAFYGLPPEMRPHRAINGVNHLLACYEALFGKLVSTPSSV